MAKLIPSFETIKRLKVKPEKGELHLLSFLDTYLDDSFEVYFNPYMNGDRPDIILMRKDYGVIIIEVKDYNLNSYELDERKNLVIKHNNARTNKSPISQVLKYKDNLFELHIENLLEKKIKDVRHFNVVSCMIYFHNSLENEIRDFFITPFSDNNRYLTFLKHNIDFLGRDNLNELDFNKILKKRYLRAEKKSFLFTKDIYDSFKRFLKPPIHFKEQGVDFRYSKKQLEIIYTAIKKQQRIKGVVGSGKTTVLAARAVQAYKRTQKEVLILTYNITLRNYIKDKISQVREEFPWDKFIISNYHLFINTELNNLGIPIVVPKDFDSYSEIQKDEYFEKKYYSNKKLFIEYKDRIKPYSVILIDEIQDYRRDWMEIIKECFLEDGGEYVLFGDVKQNIYNNKTIGKDVATNVRGVTELKRCYRSDFKIKDLVIHYQKEIFKDKYEVDSFNLRNKTFELDLKQELLGSINYMYLPNTDSISALYTIIYNNAINKEIPPNDITVLGNSISLLKEFDSYYRYSSNERTNTMFETHEMQYRMGMNYLKKSKPEWLINGLNLIKQYEGTLNPKGLNQMCILLTIYNLYTKYPDKFLTKLEYYCQKYSTTIQHFFKYQEKYRNHLNDFHEECFSRKQNKMAQVIRKNKKLHFYMNSGTIKISTIHSFKGWESDSLFLIMEKKYPKMKLTFDEILYTGITRCKSNLILINFGNDEYHSSLNTIIKKIK